MTQTEQFKKEWMPDYNRFQFSGWRLLQQFRPKDRILDIGCGYNLFKEKKECDFSLYAKILVCVHVRSFLRMNELYCDDNVRIYCANMYECMYHTNAAVCSIVLLSVLVVLIIKKLP